MGKTMAREIQVVFITEKKKMGRPTDSLKDFLLQVRLDTETKQELDSCVKAYNSSRSEIVRQGIQLVKLKLDKKK